MDAVVIIIVGIFIAGAAAGVLAVISLGIRREERRFRDDQDLFLSRGDLDGTDGFITDQPPDRLTGGARWLTGLYARHVPPPPQPADLGQDLFV